MKPTHITIPGRPVPRAVRVIRLGNKMPSIAITMRSQKWQNDAQFFINKAWAGREPIDGPVAVHCKFYFKPPKSWSKKKRQDALEGKIYPTSKTHEGDSSNILKNVEDALMPTVIKDDSLIVDSSQYKRYDTEERVEIRVYAMKGEE